MIKKILALSIICLGFISHSEAVLKIYFDEKDIVQADDGFYAHIGYNRWVVTHDIFEEDGDIYIYRDSCETYYDLDTLTAEYVNKWCCPYCHHYWPEGEPCQYKDCPRHYGKKKKKDEARINNRNETNTNRHDNEYDNRHLRDPVKPIKQPIVRHPSPNRDTIQHPNRITQPRIYAR